jgi:ribose 1,5-bisphosphokinase
VRTPSVELLSAPRERIGPGALVAVCGPSGAGKDSLLRRVQEMNGNTGSIVFPRRVVTRPVSAFEDHDTATEEQFDRMLAAGDFAFWWNAHGLKYGLAASIDVDLRAGRCVVCNVSRTVIPELRGRYGRMVAVLVTAPHEILAARLAARARGTDGNLSDRVARSTEVGRAFEADIVIDNTDSIDDGARRLQNAIESQFVVISL